MMTSYIDLCKKKNFNYQFVEVKGTPNYFAPELYKIWKEKSINRSFNPMKADMYSLGIITLRLLLGQESLNNLIAYRLLFKLEF